MGRDDSAVGHVLEAAQSGTAKLTVRFSGRQVVLLLMPLLAAVSADDDQVLLPGPHVQPVYAPSSFGRYTHPSYHYRYRVDEPYKKLRFSKVEQSRGGRTEGSYSVLLPDGRTQIVTYYVEGDSGFQAKVTYSGVAKYPAPRHPTVHQSHTYPDDDGGIVKGRPLPQKIIPGPVITNQKPAQVIFSDDSSKRLSYPTGPHVLPLRQIKASGPLDDGVSDTLPSPQEIIPRKDVPFPQSPDDGVPEGFPFPTPRRVPFPLPLGFPEHLRLHPGILPSDPLGLSNNDKSVQTSDVAKVAPQPTPTQAVPDPLVYEAEQND